ncbi:MAG: hypothetical protein HYX53_09910 [Chloroflexi bacterium]|nr:hypothetical protein [Chloroflexota bacterium]
MSFAHHRRRVIALGLAGVLAISAVGITFAEGPLNRGGGSADAGQHVRTVKDAVKTIEQITGLPKETFAQGLKDGKSINQILTENGKDPAAVQAEGLAQIKTKLDQAVADGKITQAQDDKAYARAQEALPKLMDKVPDPTAHPRLKNAIRAVKGELQVAADSIGIPVADLTRALKDGQTIAEVATANGKDPNQVIADMTAAADAKIDQAVANGKLTADQGAKAKERTAAAIARLVNEGRPRGPKAQATPGGS